MAHVVHKQAKHLASGDVIAFFTDPLSGHEVISAERIPPREGRIHPDIGVDLGDNGFVEYPYNHEVPILMGREQNG